MTDLHTIYMQRCIELAQKGAGKVAPNPMVGAVLVYKGSIIGEGYHMEYGQAHAEVNCINSVAVENRQWIPSSTLYVSLEPCAHFGKTPPCSDLIIDSHIPKVVIGCRDPFEQVNGRGIEKLEKAGIEVVPGILESECMELNKRFFTFHIQKRPYVILKWAQTGDGFIAGNGEKRLLISNTHTNRLVHRWRMEEAGILVGTNTALADNPSLTNRYWDHSIQPLRMVIDRSLRLPYTLKLFDGEQKTIVFNNLKQEERDNLVYRQLNMNADSVPQILDYCYAQGIQSILVEGGAQLHQSFIDCGIWDEARVIVNQKLTIAEGLPAPVLHHANKASVRKIHTDHIYYYTHVKE